MHREQEFVSSRGGAAARRSVLTLARLLLFLGLSLAAMPLTAAPFEKNFPKETAIAAFDEASVTHNRNLGDLYRTRGLPPPRLERVGVGGVARFLLPGRTPDPYPANSAILFYAMKDGQLTAWLIGSEGLKAAFRAPLDPAGLEQAIARLRLSLGVDGIARSRAPVLRDPAPVADSPHGEAREEIRTLSRLLLPPPIVDGLQGVEHLLIVSNGAIATVPHAVLNAGRGKMLIDRVSISVSAGLFDADQMIQPWRGRQEYAGSLIVGDPVVPLDELWRSVPRLPGAQQEAEALAQLVSAQPLLGAAARKDAVVPRMRNASLLYFAAHGVSDPRQPLTGGFLMLAGENTDRAYLRAREVQSMRLRASLAVLSACQSGLGMVHDGGVIGLSRSFQKAGVPRVVMSLWSVSDEATVALMGRFNRHALDKTPAAALRLAMLETRRDYPEPALWAPFVLFGTPR